MKEFKDPLEGTAAAAIKRSYGPQNQALEEKARNGILFEEGGLWGIKGSDGTIHFEPKYQFIGKCKNYVLFIEPNWRYQMVSPGCTESGYMSEEDRPYIENGKVGIKENGEIIIPAEYEYISKEFGGEVFLAVKDGKEKYLNNKCKEVLTRVRTFEGETLKNSPFWYVTNKFDYFTVINYVGKPCADNPNVIKAYGEWVELERYCKDEIMQMLIDPSDDLPVTKDTLSLLCSKFSYEYSFYTAKASGEKPLTQCLNQLKEMKVFSNSWYYVVKIWQAPGEYISASELRMFEKELKKTEIIGTPIFAIGHSDALQSGEVKMLFITHYHERCWPAVFEYEWEEKCRTLSINELVKHIPELKKEIEEIVIDEHKQEVYHDQLLDCIKNLQYYPNMTWSDTERSLEFFYAEGSPIKNSVISFVKKASESYKNDSLAFNFYVNAALWAIEKGDNVNAFSRNKCTPLNHVEQMRKTNRNSNDFELLQTLYDNLLMHGAKTYQTLKRERDSNKDYFKELEYLRIDGTSDKIMPSLSKLN